MQMLEERNCSFLFPLGIQSAILQYRATPKSFRRMDIVQPKCSTGVDGRNLKVVLNMYISWHKHIQLNPLHNGKRLVIPFSKGVGFPHKDFMFANLKGSAKLYIRRTRVKAFQFPSPTCKCTLHCWASCSKTQMRGTYCQIGLDQTDSYVAVFAFPLSLF